MSFSDGGALIPPKLAEEMRNLLEGKPVASSPETPRNDAYSTCCERGSKEVYRWITGGTPGAWHVESNDYGEVTGATFCPFCGTKLS